MAATARPVVFVVVFIVPVLFLRSRWLMGGLLVSQGVDGSEAGGAVGGIDTGGDADDEGDRERTHGGGGGDGHGLVEEAWEQRAPEEAEPDPEQATDESQR